MIACMNESTSETVDSGKLEAHLIDKRNEIIWHLALQDYTIAQIARMFNFRHRTTVLRIIEKRPEGYKPKWTKIV